MITELKYVLPPLVCQFNGEDRVVIPKLCVIESQLSLSGVKEYLLNHFSGEDLREILKAAQIMYDPAADYKYPAFSVDHSANFETQKQKVIRMQTALTNFLVSVEHEMKEIGSFLAVDHAAGRIFRLCVFYRINSSFSGTIS